MTEQANPRAGTTRQKALERRERIITAARQLFAKQGFHSTGVAQIAQLSGVLVGQIYRDFSGKEELIAAIVERDLADLMDDLHLADAVASGKSCTLDAWIRHFITRSLDAESRGVLTDILAESTRNPKIAAILEAGYYHLESRLITAAYVWIPDPDQHDARKELVEVILAAAGAIQNRQIFGLPVDERTVDKLVALVNRELARHGHHVN